MPTAPIPKPAKPTPLANGLVYVTQEMPGHSRVRQGERFRYRTAKGAWIDDDEEISRINALAIPPAYTSVWICPLANGHLQATGLDARGRKQYRYHAEWRALKDEAKFERLEAFGRALPRIRARVASDLRPRKGSELRRETVLATLVRLLDTTFLRVGNEEYAASNGSFGLTTLRNPHAKVGRGVLKLRFRGKSGVEHSAQVDDPRIVKIVRRCQQLPGQELFQYQGENGEPRSLSSTDVNDYLREIVGTQGPDAFTAKDFRTWHGTVQALELTRLACDANPEPGATTAVRFTAKHILAAVAEQLGNTPAVCKKAYVHPAVLALGARLAGDAEEMRAIWERIGNGHGHARLHAAERRLLGFLAAHRRTLARQASLAGKAARKSTHSARAGGAGRARSGVQAAGARAKRTVLAPSSITS
ncbi:DNA topoisomerase IB [Variovorax sp. J22R133]|uniref:DNA topoisomerase IB n=1 Tax=Variovorax brevis TaxID=3053503 RepID=UPI0025758A6E|nr:DNA topoisomerase IB [Variovorax sp. J22R133]MDM0114238.1 DNA topoisomerase IB [Variovorax sp. J22R133]